MSLQTRLNEARPGEVVVAGPCRIDAVVINVWPGTTLAGSEGTVLDMGAGLVTMWTDADAPETELRDVEIHTSNRGVQVTGTGSAVIEDVHVELERGIGIEARSVYGLRVARVTVQGIIDRRASDILPDLATTQEGGAYGLVLQWAGAPENPVELEDVEVRDVGPWGVLVGAAHVRWTGGELNGVTGTALRVGSAELELNDVRIARVWQGVQSAPACGVAAMGGFSSSLHTSGLVIEDGDGVGIMQQRFAATHDRLTVRSQARGGLRAWEDSSVTITGPSVLEDNGVVGLYVESSELDVDELSVMRTIGRRARVGETEDAEIGDGIQVVSASGSLDRVTLEGNERVGLLVDVSRGDLDDLSFGRITVSAEAESLGAVAQDESGAIRDSWDATVLREGSAETSDAAFVDPLPVVVPDDVWITYERLRP